MADVKLYRVHVDGLVYVLAAGERAAARYVENALQGIDMDLSCDAQANDGRAADDGWADCLPFVVGGVEVPERTVAEIVAAEAAARG